MKKSSMPLQQIETWRESYKNPLWRFGLTLMEIVPVGILNTVKRRDPSKKTSTSSLKIIFNR